MPYMKPKPEYVDIDDDFHPLPKYGHLSKKNSDWAALEPAVREAYAPFWAAPTWPAFRELAGDAADADAPLPPGGPDRTRDITMEKLHFPSRDGHMTELKVYRSVKVQAKATLMYRMHGGGWCVGCHEADGPENVYAASLGNIVVVSVNYRKAPEHPFPRPFHDSYDGLIWCKENASTLGVNPEKIILSGSSSGGNLAAALALETRDRKITGIIAQVLHFPSVCHPKFFPMDKYELGSYRQNHDNPVLNARAYEAFLNTHVPDPKPDFRHSPLLAESHKALPPTLIQCAGLDCLRDEAFAYAEALEADGVVVETFAYEGFPHCFPEIMLESPHTATFFQRYTSFLQRVTGG